ncbi:MAG: polysaccharide biosynthesis protein [Bacilli bacterium]|nr:polysaccharide biosynthesis protein [Bacilli bacterium]MDD4076482.1 nucleoside-diphosphate sugar epimerase/dehydratase [Bacilli bacterium]MDD4387767.1 nucleoside-diphosphate sugar epimerase/dehydratase [Bacilli bacterium]
MRKTTFLKIIGLILGDIAIIIGTYFLGIILISGDLSDPVFIIIILSVLIKIITYTIFRLYNMLLKHVGATEFIRICLAVFLSNIIIYSLLKIIDYDIDWVMFFYSTPLEALLMTLIRFSRRIYRWVSTRRYFANGTKYINTMIIGAGSAGKFVYEEIQKNDRLHNRVIAFVDDSPKKQYNRLNGIPVLGPITNIPDYIDKYNINEVIIAIANINKLRLSEIIETVSSRSVKIKRLPLMLEEESDDYRKIVDVKIEDLLNRGVIKLDNNGLNQLIRSKSVLVTGGGGSIGSELCHQILSLNPHTLILFDIYENTTYETQIDLEKRIKTERLSTRLVVIIGSVYNYKRLEDIFNQYKPQLVFHAAAYKHVPLMEFNSIEAVRTNIIGTYNVAKIANEYQSEKMILVSSDKAVRPTNVMGATKAICEKIIQYFDTVSITDYAAVRFGNVLGSHGSVIPLFKKQIENGGPVTITHPEITRFFMTITEAVSLILQSAVYAKGGEIFILDMGAPVKIIDLADKMIRLSGLIPNRDIKIEFIGLRPGEKLYEELLLDVSKNIKTANDKIYIEEKKEIINIEKHIEEIKNKIDKIANQEVKEMLYRMESTYNLNYIPE